MKSKRLWVVLAAALGAAGAGASSVLANRAEPGNCAGVNYPKGTGFIDAGGGDIHELKNNGTEPAETIAVQLIAHGQPRKIDVPQVPPGCPA